MVNRISFGNRTYVMGILNVNDDSFDSSSRCGSLEDSLRKAEQMVMDGADIIDIGAESTRPFSSYVEEGEELSRIIPVVRELVKLEVPVSVDTYKPSVAKQALDNGVWMINDVSAGRDPASLELVKEYESRIVLMHNNIKDDALPHAKPVSEENKEIVQEVLRDLKELASRALSYGIPRESIVLDPGIGFQKNWKDSLRIMGNIYRIKELGYPVLVGASNKGFIGKVLSINNPEDRLEGTLACTAISVMQGADIVRVHNVMSNAEVARFTDYVYRA